MKENKITVKMELDRIDAKIENDRRNAKVAYLKICAELENGNLFLDFLVSNPDYASILKNIAISAKAVRMSKVS